MNKHCDEKEGLIRYQARIQGNGQSSPALENGEKSCYTLAQIITLGDYPLSLVINPAYMSGYV